MRAIFPNDTEVSDRAVLGELSQTAVDGVSLNTPKAEPLRLPIQEGKYILLLQGI